MQIQMSQALSLVLKYHQETKHRFNAYARGPGRLDWANQPDPFRRYIGSPQIMLERDASQPDLVDTERRSAPARLSFHSISSFFFNSLALSAWKSAGGTTWPLRVNPSSGNLHPTEGYLITGEIEGLDGSPGIFHYAPQVHALERRSGLSGDGWANLGLPEGTFLVAISSIYWRESWKYGERAFRYSMTDVGHAQAALGISASCLRWRARLLEEAGTDDLSRLLGIAGAGSDGGETEHPDCLLAIFTDGEIHDTVLAS
jgi:SagB-type dehydrogenase family enzyme